MQLTLNFNPGLSSSHDTCREFVQECVIKNPLPNKAIAADMDLSPSALSRKLSQGVNDNARFTLDDLERYIRVTGDTEPILWLVDKYFKNSDRIAQLERELAILKSG